jgi:uncharacterized membrane protein YraQ (UPF0718 family)
MTIQLTLRPPRERGRGWLAVAALAWIGAFALNERLWDWLLLDVLGLDPEQRVTEVVHFFLFDAIKIALLLVGITFMATLLRSFLSVERTRALLSGKRGGVGNVIAASLGVATPFCSCSAVPAFIGFVAAGVPVGVTMSFLIASPLVNEVAIALLFGIFGWKVALAYAGAGWAIAIASGLLIARIRADRWVEPFVLQAGTVGGGPIELRPRISDRITMAIEEVRSIVGRIWPYLLGGIAIGAILHGWAPTEFFARYASADNPLAVLIAVIVGLPLYSNAAGVMPIVLALHEQGVAMGTLLAFMMSVVALSLPELILLKRVLRTPLLAAFVGIVASGIVMIGYLFNFLLT